MNYQNLAVETFRSCAEKGAALLESCAHILLFLFFFFFLRYLALLACSRDEYQPSFREAASTQRYTVDALERVECKDVTTWLQQITGMPRLQYARGNYDPAKKSPILTPSPTTNLQHPAKIASRIED